MELCKGLKHDRMTKWLGVQGGFGASWLVIQVIAIEGLGADSVFCFSDECSEGFIVQHGVCSTVLSNALNTDVLG